MLERKLELPEIFTDSVVGIPALIDQTYWCLDMPPKGSKMVRFGMRYLPVEDGFPVLYNTIMGVR